MRFHGMPLGAGPHQPDLVPPRKRFQVMVSSIRLIAAGLGGGLRIQNLRLRRHQLAGYTEEEKLEIAKRYLVKRQIERNGLDPSKIEFTEEALREIAEGYTREAGVRNLEREIGAVCRKIALRQAEGGGARRRVIRRKQVRDMLGRRRFLAEIEIRRRTSEPGVAAGLAWTPTGGEILFVEATAFPGKARSRSRANWAT